MRDEEQHESAEENRGWYSDHEALLVELQRTGSHWAKVPEIPGYDSAVEMSRGGQGIVYRARQISTGRSVALKVLLDGVFASDASRSRFHREIDVVARLRHPAIVPIYDCGVTDDGRPYYVMDYIDGVPIDDRSLAPTGDLRRTLELFARVCDAVDHAHQHGVIHRDLKPGNILVDSEFEPHVLDFGLAKIAVDTADEPPPATSVSQTGQFLGSLAWASPEQIEESIGGIGVRSDVYSLGVILYHLLTGRLPHRVTKSVRQTMNAILNEEPPAPRSLRRDIPGDVETIVRRCLAKEPRRRYPTVGELARDVRRYLSGEPIEAKRDRTGYVLRKAIGRHKAVASLLALLVLIVVGVAITMTVLYDRTRKAERRAVASLDEATTEARKTEEVRGFLEQILASSDPFASTERALTVREALDSASRQIEGRFGDYPEVEAEVRTVIANSYYGLGRLAEAEAHYERALELRRESLGESHVDTAASLRHLAVVRTDQRRLEEAEELLERALAILTVELGEKDERTAHCILNLAELRQAQFLFEESNELYGRAFEIYVEAAGEDDGRRLTTLIQWSTLLIAARDIESAEKKLGQALEIIRANPVEYEPYLGGTLLYLALARINRGDGEAARPLLEEAIEAQERVFGPNHPRIAEMYNTMAKTYRAEGRHDEVERWFRKGLEVCDRSVGRVSASSAHSLWGIARARFEHGNVEGAVETFREAIEVRRKVYEPGHHLVGASILTVGLLLEKAGRYEQALPFLKELADAPPRTPDGDRTLSPSIVRALVSCLEHLGRLDEAAEYSSQFAENESAGSGSPASGESDR